MLACILDQAKGRVSTLRNTLCFLLLQHIGSGFHRSVILKALNL